MRRLLLTVLVGAMVAAAPASAQPFPRDRDFDRDHDRDHDRGPSRWARELVTTWFEHYLGSKPDPDSLRIWSARLDAATNPNQTLSTILGEHPYFVQTGSTNRSWLATTFHSITGRDPTPRELHYWLGRLFQIGGESPSDEDRMSLAYELLERYPQGAMTTGRDHDEDYDYRRPDNRR